jgi:hypothetical protein
LDGRNLTQAVNLSRATPAFEHFAPFAPLEPDDASALRVRRVPGFNFDLLH